MTHCRLDNLCSQDIYHSNDGISGCSRKAQASIDALLQEERLPTFADRAELPYVDAVLKEVLRYVRRDAALC